MQIATAEDSMRIKYEQGPCGRCNGSGRYSYCQIHGDTCFGCSGKGVRLTRAGRRAANAVSKFLRESYSLPIEEVEPGRQIRTHSGDCWRRVLEPPVFSEITRCWSVKTKHVTYCAPRGSRIQVRPTSKQFDTEVVPFARGYNGATIEK